MTGCRMIVRTPEGVWQGEVDSWTSLVVLAGLTAEPETFEEFAEALRRYQPDHCLFDESDGTGGLDSLAVPDEPWCLVDLVGRTVVAGSGFDLPEPRGAFEADDDDCPQGFPIVWLDTPADWLFRQADHDWQALVVSRARDRVAANRVDARAVLFGRCLLEHLAKGVLAAGSGAVDEETRLQQTRSIHAAWLMTERADLG